MASSTPDPRHHDHEDMTISTGTDADTDVAERPSAGLRAVASTSRHPGDAIRVGLGLGLLAVSLLAIQRDDLTTFEVNLFRLVNELPDPLRWVLGPLMQLGNVVAAPAVAAIAFVVARRSRRISFDIVLAGVLAWFAAKLVKSLVERPRPGGLVDDVFRIAGTEGLGFVSGHTAVSTAIVAAASPYLPRHVRRVVWAVPVTVGLARIYYGAHLPLDIVGGAALGWAIAAGVHLLLGAPHRVPTPADAERVLRDAGVAVSGVERLDADARGSFPFVAHVRGADRFVKLLDPEPRDRDWVYRAGRFLAFRDVRDEASIAEPSTQAHREAAMTLLAGTHGARVPTIAAIESSADRVWIVEELIDGQALDRLPSHAVTDDVLDSLWEQLAALRDARIAHRDLVASNVLVAADGQVWIVDFAHAQTSTRGRTLDNDVAELLVSTALVVGVDRAVAAAARRFGPDVLAAAVPELQRFVLTGENRRKLRGKGSLLDELRVATAAAAGTPLPSEPVEEPRRARPAVVVAIAVATLAALISVAGPSDVADVVSTPGFRWLGLALLSVPFAAVLAAGALVAGIDRRLALGRTAAEVMVFQRRNTLDGRDAGRRSLVRGLEGAGVPASEAASALRRWTLARLAAALFGVVVFAAVAAANGASFSSDGDVGAVAGVFAAALVVELLVGHGTRIAAEADPGAPRPPARANPWMIAMTSIGEVGLGVLATTATVLAMGGGVAIATVCVVAASALTVARVAPVAGGPGTTAAFLVLGLVAAGMPVAVAAAAALLAQLAQLWVPVVGGMIRSTPLAPW